jgi:uncharacterized protein YjbJ (UPF0337 family)
MGKNMDDLKGRAKEAVGDLTDDSELKKEGKLDQVKSTVKDKTDEAIDKVKDVVGK